MSELQVEIFSFRLAYLTFSHLFCLPLLDGMKSTGDIFRRLEAFYIYFLEEESRGGAIVTAFCRGVCSFVEMIRTLTRLFISRMNGPQPSVMDIVGFSNSFKPYILYLEELTNCKIIPKGFDSFEDYQRNGFLTFPRGAKLFSLLYNSLQVVDSQIVRLTKYLYTSALAPFLKMLQEWVNTGKVVDPFLILLVALFGGRVLCY